MQRITSPASKLDTEALAKLLPGYDPDLLQRKSSNVDVLLGCDYFRLHQKQEARCGNNLSIMNGALGIYLQRAHPDLIEGAKYDTNLAKKIHDVNIQNSRRLAIEFIHAINHSTILTDTIKWIELSILSKHLIPSAIKRK